MINCMDSSFSVPLKYMLNLKSTADPVDISVEANACSDFPLLAWSSFMTDNLPVTENPDDDDDPTDVFICV